VEVAYDEALASRREPRLWWTNGESGPETGHSRNDCFWPFNDIESQTRGARSWTGPVRPAAIHRFCAKPPLADGKADAHSIPSVGC